MLRTIIPLTAFAVLCVPTFTFGHTDDPKATDLRPPVLGPVIQRDRDGAEADGLYDSRNVSLQSLIPINAFDSSVGAANDCWGYVSPSGREYALVGLDCGTGIAEVTNPGSATVIEFFPGPCCVWRDIKTFNEYAYVVSECGLGIQILDLSNIDDGVVVELPNVPTAGEASHNVAIDTTSGFLYRTGGSGNGLLIFDLNQDPVNPPLVGAWPDRYVHDAQVITLTQGPNAGTQLAICCSGLNSGWVDPGIDLLDVTAKNDIRHVGQLIYDGGEYSHQGWLSHDERYFYHGDELDEGTGIPSTTYVIDIQDLTQPVVATTFTNGNSAVTHNLYTRGRFIYEANYASGLRVFDAEDPLAPVEVAFFDTRPEDDGVNYSGMWSNYPLLPSGTVIASDRQRGLFVLEVDLPEAPGDIDGDGVVGFQDLLIMLGTWGDCPAEGCPADLDGDGVVDFNDLLALLSYWSA